MAFNSNKFVNNIVSLTVAIIVVCVIAIPIITEQSSTLTGSTKTIVEILPIFMVIGVLMAAVSLFLKNKSE